MSFVNPYHHLRRRLPVANFPDCAILASWASPSSPRSSSPSPHASSVAPRIRAVPDPPGAPRRALAAPACAHCPQSGQSQTRASFALTSGATLSVRGRWRAVRARWPCICISGPRRRLIDRNQGAVLASLYQCHWWCRRVRIVAVDRVLAFVLIATHSFLLVAY